MYIKNRGQTRFISHLSKINSKQLKRDFYFWNYLNLYKFIKPTQIVCLINTHMYFDIYIDMPDKMPYHSYQPLFDTACI